MPAKSQSQRGLIFSRREQYGSKDKTPKKWKWIWDEEWENKGKLPDKVKNETVQNVVFKESTRAKLVKESTGEDYPWGAKAVQYKDPDIKKIVRENRDGEIELVWGEDEVRVIDPYELDKYLAHRLNLNFDKYEESGETVLVDFEEVEEDVYKLSAASGDYITVDFDDLAELASY